MRWAVASVRFLAWLVWAGALGFAGYRVYQMRTLPSVEAEVLQAATESYTSTAYRKNAAGWNEPTRSRMYVPTALVRYRYNGRTVAAMAKHDTGFSWKWVQDQVTRGWKPGSRIRIHIDPAQPEEPLAGLGLNLSTFLPVVLLAAFGGFLTGCAWVLQRVVAAVGRAVTGQFP